MPVFAVCNLKMQKLSACGRRALPGSLANQPAFPQSSVGAGWWCGLGCLHTPFVSDTALSLSTGVNRERINDQESLLRNYSWLVCAVYAFFF